MKKIVYNTALWLLGLVGPQIPPRSNRNLDKLSSLIAQASAPKEKIQQKRFLIKKKLYTFYYGNQILRTAKSIGKQFYCGGPSRVNHLTVIKDYVCFNGMYIDGRGKVTIGSYFHSGIECMIITANHDYDTGVLIPYGVEYDAREVVIDDFVWLGRRVTILPGTHIGEGAIIQAGSVVHGEIPPYAIAGGNPAKVFRYRDIKHFQELKSKGMVLSNEKYCEFAF